MKALNKGKAAQFFKKNQQKKQDINQVINEVQAKCIATQVGIAQQQIPTFKWFFDQLEKFKLPLNYEKQINQKRTQITYFNKNTNESTTVHPLLSMIRTFFYTEYKSNRSTFTFSNKQQKLLPYVEDRMMKNCISLNSKRRQVQKLNLQKDQNGKIVLSKMARIAPDTKNLVSARNYMLKMLIQKVYTTKQIWGKGKRAKALANVMNEKYKDVEEEGDVMDSVDPQDLQTYQSILTEAAKFYDEQFEDLLTIPSQLLQSYSYKNSTPESIVKYLSLLNISKNQVEFYWFARLMDCLPLPHNWSINLSTNIESYFYEPLKLKFDIHPSYIYVILQMNKFKDYFSTLTDDKKIVYYENRKMTFVDFFQRQYTVDIYGLLLQQELKNLPKDNKNSLLKQNNLKIKQQNTNDWMVVEAIINSGMKPQEYPLIGAFCDFWASKNFYEQEWIPTVSPFGEITWSDSVNYSSIDYCPYAQILKNKLQIQRQNLMTFEIQDFKQNLRQDIKIIDGKIEIKPSTQTEIQLIKISQQRQKFIEHYIKNIDNPSPAIYDIKTNNITSYFDQIFICSFNIQVQNSGENNFCLEQDDEEIPLWKQKVHARKFSAKIKNAIRSNCDLQQLKQLVKQFTQNTTSKNQPHRRQQMREKLINVRNLKQLEQFVDNVTDIDAREERKRKELQRMKQNGEEEDIFGSQEEDVNIQQAEIMVSQKQESQHHELQSQAQSQKFHEQQQQQEQQEQSSSSLSQSQKQPSIRPFAQQQTLQQAFQQHIQRSQYSFIKQFKKQQKPYKKSKVIEQADEQKIQTLIKKQMKTKTKTLKYTNSHLKNNLIYQKKLFNNLKNDQQTKNIKKNLIQTNFKYSTVPHKDQRIFKFENNQTASQFLNKKKNIDKIQKIQLVKNHSTFQPVDNSHLENGFQSEIDEDYETSEIIEHIESLPKKQEVEQIQLDEEDLAQYEIKITPKKQDEIIFLQPIKRTKPDIQQDPRLRHIRSLDPQDQFNLLNTIFMKKTNIKQKQIESPVKIKFRSRSSSNLIKPLQSTQNSSSKSISLLKDSPVKNKQISPFQTLKSLKKDKIIQQKIFPSVTSYNRVCLDRTASTLLISEPIKRKSQLLVLQARKNLLHKGRGLETYLSRKY